MKLKIQPFEKTPSVLKKGHIFFCKEIAGIYLSQTFLGERVSGFSAHNNRGLLRTSLTLLQTATGELGFCWRRATFRSFTLFITFFFLKGGVSCEQKPIIPRVKPRAGA